MLSFISLALLASTTLSLPIDITTSINSTLAIASLTTTIQTVGSTPFTFNATSAACGFRSVSDVVVSLPLSFEGSTLNISSYCGAYLILNSNITQKTVTVRVVDQATTSSIGLSSGVYSALGSNAAELGLVNWTFATLNETEEVLEATMSSGAAAALLGMASASHVQPDAAVVTPTVVDTPAAVVVSASPVANVETTTESPAYTPAYTPPATTPAAVKTTTAAAAKAPVATVQAAVSSSGSSSSSSSTSSSSSSSSGTYSGQATYYTQGGVAGACGKVNPDSAYIVAIDIDMYNGGSNCGRMVHITNTATGASVTAQVADECPTCASSGSLDLSVAAFNAIGNESQGVIPMTWSFV